AVDAVPAGRLRLAAPPALPPTEAARGALARDWWVYSFSQLAREADGGAGPAPLDTATRGAGDEPAEAAPDLRFSGARFGNVLHAALERVDFACWRQPDAVPPEQRAILAEALREGGYGGDEVLADGLRLLAELVAATLAAPLPEGARLADLPAAARRSEMEFHLSMAPVAIPDLIALLHAHDVLRGRRGFGLRARIEGLMTGFIDLVYRHDGRYYVLDYKSNRLRDYGAAALEAAMRESEYDLQALIYTLALHRYLRARLPDYAYARHMGGVRYLFCRGLDGSGRGVFATRFPEELVTALDALLGGGA
ncbi:PD-(D/E)XK nuclease family protein, partial [Coralloluteibacterium thermophilus]